MALLFPLRVEFSVLLSPIGLASTLRGRGRVSRTAPAEIAPAEMAHTETAATATVLDFIVIVSSMLPRSRSPVATLWKRGFNRRPERIAIQEKIRCTAKETATRRPSVGHGGHGKPAFD